MSIAGGSVLFDFTISDGHIIEVGEDMKMVVNRFLNSGMTIEEVSIRMDVSIEDLTSLLNS